MSEQVEHTEYYTKRQNTVVVVTIEPNMDRLKADISEYFDNNTIDGSRYTLTSASIGSDYAGRKIIKILFDYAYDDGTVEMVDEDFEPDDAFDEFMAEMSNRYQMKVTYPSWYLPK